jgi:retron-type reverse transcriptase
MIGDLPKILEETFGLNDAQVQRLMARSPHTYKIYAIPKKSGGVRTIAQPAKETKYIQHWLMQTVFNKLPVHDSAAAYKAGASIKANAQAHAHNPYISKFDFEMFFSSITEANLKSHLARWLGSALSARDIGKIARLACLSPKDGTGLCLSVGAPSSPVLSNSVMYEFDVKISEWCKAQGMIYTRYADDLTFSTNRKEITVQLEPEIRRILQNLEYPTLRINDKKTIHLSKKNQRRITGIVINNKDEISIGRERKRAISSLIHRFSVGALPPEDIFNLQGLLGFAKDIEPIFIVRMRTKYGSKTIDDIFQARKEKKILPPRI